MPGGLFLSFEGPDGCGKTTQMSQAARRLRNLGYEVVESVEPGGTSIGRQIRSILLERTNTSLRPTAELLLYFAARAQNVEEVILPALEAGRIVLTDRFTDSTLAYQGYARGLGEEVVLALDRIACRGVAPQLTLQFDVDAETARSRARLRPHGADRMESQDADFHERVRDAYLQIAAREPGRIVVIDARGTIDDVAQRVWEHIERMLRNVPQPARSR